MNVTERALELPPWEEVLPNEPYDGECEQCDEREEALLQRRLVESVSDLA